MKKMILTIVIMTLIIVFVFLKLVANETEPKDYIIDTNEQALIHYDNGFFSESTDEMVKILNNEFIENGLPPVDYDSRIQIINMPGNEPIYEGDGFVNSEYYYRVGEKNIWIKFISTFYEGGERYYGAEGMDKVEVIELTAFSDGKSKYSNLLKKYYNCICKIVEPTFDSNRFANDTASLIEHGGVYNYKESSRATFHDEWGGRAAYIISTRADYLENSVFEIGLP